MHLTLVVSFFLQGYVAPPNILYHMQTMQMDTLELAQARNKILCGSAGLDHWAQN